MIYLLGLLLTIPTETNRLTIVSDSLYEMINGLAGRSWIFDNLADLSLESNLVKAALIGACFMFAWLAKADDAEVARRRKILLITLIASVFVIATTKTLSKIQDLPARPLIIS